jgi:hypothetical protein
MKLKTIWIATLLVAISIFPAICSNIGESKSNEKFSDLNNEDFTYVRFCFGRISDIHEIRSGYTICGWSYLAKNVICIIDFKNKPIINHFTNNEELGFSFTKLGILYGNFVCAIDIFGPNL